MTGAAWAVLAWLCSTLALAQPATPWVDPSPHRAQFVEVAEGVRLEVLDWGGSGRRLVLLSGSGHTAHVYDELAPKLRDAGHVYGITRRGYGASSQPPNGYNDRRLADDVLAVIDALKLQAPVVAGHSMGGGEITTLGRQHSDRLGSLIYLDALGDPRDFMGADPHKTPRAIHAAIGDGQIARDYSKIRVPVLALVDLPRTSTADFGREDQKPRNDEEAAAIIAFNKATRAFMERWSAKLKAAVPDARIVDLPGARHYLLVRETDTLREIRAFMASLPPPSDLELDTKVIERL